MATHRLQLYSHTSRIQDSWSELLVCMTKDLVLSLKGHGPNWWKLLALGTKASGNVALVDEDGEGKGLLKQIMILP